MNVLQIFLFVVSFAVLGLFYLFSLHHFLRKRFGDDAMPGWLNFLNFVILFLAAELVSSTLYQHFFSASTPNLPPG